MGRKNIGSARSFLEYFSTKAASVDRDRTLASTKTTLVTRFPLATISSPVSGEPPAIARFLKLSVAKYSSLSRKLTELPTRATSGTDSWINRLNVISVPSRVVVDENFCPLPNQAVATPQASRSKRAPNPHLANQCTVEMSCIADSELKINE